MSRLALCVVLIAGCTTDLTPAGYAMFDGPERVTTSHVSSGFKSYGGAPLATWTITLTTLEGCTPNGTVLDMEIDILSNGSALPTGTPIPFRAVPDTIGSLPSAVLSYGTNALTSGSLMLENASSGLLSGSFTFQTGAGKFTGPVCPSS